MSRRFPAIEYSHLISDYNFTFPTHACSASSTLWGMFNVVGTVAIDADDSDYGTIMLSCLPHVRLDRHSTATSTARPGDGRSANHNLEQLLQGWDGGTHDTKVDFQSIRLK